MKVQVRFRFNKRTGEIEEFLIDDHDSNLSTAEHNRQHDQISNEVGCVIAQYPRIQEVASSTLVTQPNQQSESSEEEADNTNQSEQRQKS